jgi:ATP-dependent exoDNAse (exonuclease V) beta subunit
MSMDLNPGQREAVEARASRVVVSAGAGSGKTRVLVQRFVDRVLEREAAGEPSPMRSVLLITFTDKAAGELTERVRRTLLEAGRTDLAREVDGAWISTIHSFCARIVKRHALELGVDVGFTVLADPRGGLERTEAFERAARRCLKAPDVGDRIAALVQDGVASLRATVLAGYDRARSKGVAIEEVTTARAGGCLDALAQLACTLDAVLPEYRGLNQTATVAANLASFVRLRAKVSDVMEMDGEREKAEAVCAFGSHKGASRGGEEMRTLTASVNDALRLAVQEAVDTLAAQRAEAWRTLLLTFSEEYESAKRMECALDFEDLQLLTRRLWAERPDIAERVSGQFAEVMVDEFQDINPLQLQVIGPISGGGQCVVGDVQQSIYRFRDADVGLLEQRRRAAERSQTERSCRLTVNYRSDGRLLEGLNRIFGSAEFFGGDYLTLEAGGEGGGEDDWPAGTARIEGLIVDKSLCPGKDWRQVEARALAQRLRAVVAEGWARPEEIVVLVRASTTMPVYIAALRDAGFDVIAPASGGFYATPEYADVRALLRVLANPLDDEAVLSLLAGGLGGVSDDALLVLAHLRTSAGLWSALGEHSASLFDEADAARAAALGGVVERLRDRRGHLPLADAILHAASVLGAGGGLLESPEAWANVRKVVRIAAEFEGLGAGDPAALLSYLDDRETYAPREPSAGLVLEGAEAVRVMTVHAAKGLEFPVVAVADLGHRPPNTHPAFLLSSRGDRLVAVSRGPERVGGEKVPKGADWQAAVDVEKALDLAEAKRVFYVACTRAERALILAGSVDAPDADGEDIAAAWVLEASQRDGIAHEGVLTVRLLGADDVPGAPERAEPTHGVEDPAFEETSWPHHLPVSEPIASPQEVSYTALALYDKCSYRFFAERMLRVGSLKLARDEDPMAFGSALHAAMELLARGETVDAEVLGRLAASHGLPQESVERLARARKSVHGSGLEDLIGRGRPEVPFAIAVEGGVVRGTMDLVVIEGDRATVLDYKSGRTWDATGSRYEAQAEVYALALLEAGSAAVDMRFVHVEAGCEEAAYSYTTIDRPRIRAQVELALSRMRAGDFPPLRAFDPVLCADCPVSGGLCRVVHPHTRLKRVG